MTALLRRTTLAGALLLLPALVGCNPAVTVAGIKHLFNLPDTIEPVFEPPKDMKVLVFVDDLGKPVDYQPMKRELANRIGEQLIKNEVAASVVPYSKIEQLAASAPDFDALYVTDVGKRLGADLVLYVFIDYLSLHDRETGILWRGELAVRIQWLDADKPERLWPMGSRYYPVKPVTLPTIQDTSAAYGETVADKLATQTADRIAKLFYEHKVYPSDQDE